MRTGRNSALGDLLEIRIQKKPSGIEGLLHRLLQLVLLAEEMEQNEG